MIGNSGFENAPLGNQFGAGIVVFL